MIMDKKHIIISSLVKDNIINELNTLGINCLKAGKSENIQGETAFHTDMLYYKLSDGTLLTEKGFVHNLDTNVKILESRELLGGKYPLDCIFNCFTAGSNLICGKSTAREILNDATTHGYSICRVNQGYAACSTVRLHASSYICSDDGISATLRNLGFDVLTVTNNGINLNGYNCGFIGGCALYSDKELVTFSGDIRTHPDYHNIKAFCNNYNIKPYSLSNGNLYDYGGYISL